MRDHSCFLIKASEAIETRQFVDRLVWKLEDVNGPAIEKHISGYNQQLLQEGSIDEALDLFVYMLEEQMSKHIPRIKKLVEKFRQIGFRHISVDLEGYMSGSLNRGLENERGKE